MARMQWSEHLQKLMPGGVTRTEFDHLPVPGKKTIAELSNGELANLLIAAGIPNVSHTAPRIDNLKAYEKHVGKIMSDAAWAALNEWVKAKS